MVKSVDRYVARYVDKFETMSVDKYVARCV